MESGFKNIVSKRFHEFFEEKVRKKEVTYETIAEKFGSANKSNPGAILRSLSYGAKGVTVEMILLAQQHFGLNPCELFKNVDDEINKLKAHGPVEFMEVIYQQLDVIKSQQRTAADGMEVIKSQQATIHLLVEKKRTPSRQRASA